MTISSEKKFTSWPREKYKKESNDSNSYVPKKCSQVYELDF